MLFKKHVKQTLIIANSQKLPACIPLVIYYILLPILNYMEYQKYGMGYELYNNIVTFAQFFIPLFSTWNGMINIKDYIEGDGREVLYINNKNPDLWVFLISAAINVICLLPLFAVYSILFKNMMLECIRLILFIIFFCSVAMSAVVLTNSLALTFSILFLYTIFSIFGNHINSLFLYYNTDIANVHIILYNNIPLMLIGVLFLCMVMAIRKSKRKYM